MTLDDALDDVPGGDVRVQDEVITEIGVGLRPGPDAEVVDATGRLVIPGLIDAHRHVWQGAIGGFTPQMTGYGPTGPPCWTGSTRRIDDLVVDLDAEWTDLGYVAPCPWLMHS